MKKKYNYIIGQASEVKGLFLIKFLDLLHILPYNFWNKKILKHRACPIMEVHFFFKSDISLNLNT